MIELHFDGPERSELRIALAHGAGAAMDSPFMEQIASGLGRAGLRVARFEFPYMHARRTSGRRSAPDREPVLRATWMEVIGAMGGAGGLVIGGKSMGGRIASLIADEAGVRGLVCLGYPFHPTGRAEKLRIDHLRDLQTPALIVQGTRDAFGSRAEVDAYPLSAHIKIAWIAEGDHSLKPPRRSGRSEAQNLDEAVAVVAQFVKRLAAGG